MGLRKRTKDADDEHLDAPVEDAPPPTPAAPEPQRGTRPRVPATSFDLREGAWVAWHRTRVLNRMLVLGTLAAAVGVGAQALATADETTRTLQQIDAASDHYADQSAQYRDLVDLGAKTVSEADFRTHIEERSDLVSSVLSTEINWGVLYGLIVAKSGSVNLVGIAFNEVSDVSGEIVGTATLTGTAPSVQALTSWAEALERDISWIRDPRRSWRSGPDGEVQYTLQVDITRGVQASRTGTILNFITVGGELAAPAPPPVPPPAPPADGGDADPGTGGDPDGDEATDEPAGDGADEGQGN